MTTPDANTDRIAPPDDDPVTIAVLGANGRLGSAVVAAAAQSGHRVLAVTRTGMGRGDGPDGEGAAIEFRSADGSRASALARAVEGADVVVNALSPIYTD